MKVLDKIKNKIFPVDQQKIIKEIHETFFNEVNILKELASLEETIDIDSNLISKSDRLEKIGATSTKEVKLGNMEKEKISLAKNINRKNKELIEAINYFSMYYPNNKFITEESVTRICEKYNLVYGEISKYVGEIPDKNLSEIESFKMRDDDFGYIKVYSNDFSNNFSTLTDKETYLDYCEDIKRKCFRDIYEKYRCNYIEKKKLPLEIVAPLSDFNMTKSEIKKFKISDIKIEDPVVLQPVIFKKNKYYLILTAWGIEAKDELVVNHKFN